MLRVEYRLLIWYDIRADKYEQYYRYMVSEFVPAVREIGLHMYFVWQIRYGDYPARQLEFVIQDVDTLRTALSSNVWLRAEDRLKSYTANYGRKIINFENRFQF